MELHGERLNVVIDKTGIIIALAAADSHTGCAGAIIVSATRGLHSGFRVARDGRRRRWV